MPVRGQKIMAVIKVCFVPAPKVEATVSSEEKAALKGLFDS